MDFHAVCNSHVLQASAHRRMLNLVVAVDVFNFRIRNPAVVFEKRRQIAARDVARLIDRRGKHGATMLAVPDGIVGAAAKKRDSKWGARDDHEVSKMSRSVILVSQIQGSRLCNDAGMRTKGLITNRYLTFVSRPPSSTRLPISMSGLGGRSP